MESSSGDIETMTQDELTMQQQRDIENEVCNYLVLMIFSIAY